MAESGEILKIGTDVAQITSILKSANGVGSGTMAAIANKAQAQFNKIAKTNDIDKMLAFKKEYQATADQLSLDVVGSATKRRKVAKSILDDMTSQGFALPPQAEPAKPQAGKLSSLSNAELIQAVDEAGELSKQGEKEKLEQISKLLGTPEQPSVFKQSLENMVQSRSRRGGALQFRQRLLEQVEQELKRLEVLSKEGLEPVTQRIIKEEEQQRQKEILEATKGRLERKIRNVSRLEKGVLLQGQRAYSDYKKIIRSGASQQEKDRQVKALIPIIARSFMLGSGIIGDEKKVKSFFELFQEHKMGSDYNFCGSGTPIFRNLLSGKLPFNEIDEICLDHDLEYLRAGSLGSVKQKQALNRADEAFKQDLDSIINASDEDIERALLDGRLPLEAGERARVGSEFEQVTPSMIKEHAENVRRDARLAVGAINTIQTIRSAGLEQFVNRLSGETISQVVKRKMMEDMIALMEKANEEAGVELFTADQLSKEYKEIYGSNPRLENVQGTGTDEDIDALLQSMRRGAGGATSAAQGASSAAQEEEKDPDAPREGPLGADEGPSDLSRTVNIDLSEIEKRMEQRPIVGVDAEAFKDRHLPAPTDSNIVGDRSMRVLLKQGNTDSVKTTDEQRRQNRLWLENFTWIDEGKGNGNQERVPWNFTGGKSRNTLFNAQKQNKYLQYRGDLYMGDAEYKPPQVISELTRVRNRELFIPNVQNRQAFVRNGPLPAGLGQPIKMMSGTQHLPTPMGQIHSIDRRLIHPDMVVGPLGPRRV